ncbi:MAG: Lacal_2735 family protein [Wenzhouxiangella sp.]|nr:MAG: Lacal_2735 family protein [Wenzhouxiangella sp.]
MFGFLKSDPVKKLRKQYDAKLDQALHAQRNGDIKGYAKLTEEANAIWKELEPLEKGN